MPSNGFSVFFTPQAVAPLLHVKDQVFVFLDWLTPYSTVLSLVFITGIAYCFLRIEQIVHETKHEDTSQGNNGHGTGYEADGGKSGHDENLTEKRWQQVVIRLDSDRESDWRLAVLEADVLLDEMVTHMGYHGDSLGERLKGVEKSDFITLDQAWEAHAVRNRIAHEGSTFALTDREARRVIKLYEEVFREFHYI